MNVNKLKASGYEGLSSVNPVRVEDHSPPWVNVGNQSNNNFEQAVIR
ncbi:MAG: hypothetical protein AAFV90_03055 [Cyanobacteria bacterium J06634_5]